VDRRALVHGRSGSSRRRRSHRARRRGPDRLPVAERLLGIDPNPSTVYVRADQDRSRRLRDLLGRAANPEHPEEVDVSRPSMRSSRAAAAKTAFTSLFLGLGAVALLVGGVGIANVMVISVLERRSEVGCGARWGPTRRHVGAQFLCESVLLAAGGGVAGVALGALVTAAYAGSQGGWSWCRASRWPAAWPPRWRSACWPAATRRCGRRDSRRPRP
jgi:cell division protein FtsX